MDRPYSKQFDARWADLDPNGHLRHTAYNDYASHVRVRYLFEWGFGAEQFAQHGVGPVIFREETWFFKEVGGDDSFTVTFVLAGATPDGARFRMRHNILLADGRRAAAIELDGGWLDLSRRRLTVPPEGLGRAVLALAHTDDFDPDYRRPPRRRF